MGIIQRIAWLLTHDNHIDRRIFFFADVFRELGYKVLLFSSYSNDALDNSDPDYVCRPEVKKTIKCYKDRELFQIGETPDPDVNNFFVEFISFIEGYKANFERYPTSCEELEKAGFTSDLDYYFIAGSQKWFSMAVKNYNGEWYVYNNLIGKVRSLKKESIEQINMLDDMVYKVKREKIFNNSLVPFGHLLDMECQNSDIEKCMTHSGESIIIKVKKVDETDIYEYESGNETVILKKRIPLRAISKDEFMGNTYDFIEFRQIIFDYSPILERVKQEINDYPNQSPDIVYVADLPTLPIGYMLKDSFKCKLIVDCHEWWKEQSILWEPQNSIRINAMDKYERLFYQICDLRITVGQLLAEKMSEYFGKKFEVIYSCITKDHENIINRRSDFWQSEFGLPEDARISVFQGSLTTLRNLDNLAKATKYLTNDCYLVVVGAGPYQEEFERIVKKEGNPEKVRYAGWVPQNKLLEYTINAHLGILPYKSLNSYYALSVPNKFLEYYAAQIPILCDGTLMEVANIVTNNNIGFCVNCSDPEELGTAICRALKDNVLDMVKEQYLKIGSKFGYDSQKVYFIKMLNKLVSQ
ncbi:glycosyltransferase [Desulforamulus ferrireducens]|uniref:Glycosyl transferase family 1 domain-containing protein n=1 Tax=Desulforamulus ferrireducens TaxID=1833852 RepID=A0A1S6J001_9FIRM|nr:glycosyltransferase [Desulforamulus ferrireducens]AQS60356.1 hypothetical protein B0537_15555 [Desulforamulus ferrireducens]